MADGEDKPMTAGNVSEPAEPSSAKPKMPSDFSTAVMARKKVPAD